MKLTIKWDDFSKQINNFVTEVKAISTIENTIKTDAELEKVKTDVKNWNDRCYEFLKNSFDNERNEYATAFRNANGNRFQIENPKKEFRQIKKEVFDDLKNEMNTLAYINRILSISDIIIKPEIFELSNRNSYTTDQTLELILDKLYDLYDNSYYPIPTILEGNGISLKRLYEDRELGKKLETTGYVNITNQRDTLAQLTLQGKIYIEDKRKTYHENYEDINKSQAEINSRVDEIIEHLSKLGLGQEIIFNEIQELKELYTTLNKKNWGQVVKGKIVDLALSKLIENDTLSYIYEKLTDHQLRLP